MVKGLESLTYVEQLRIPDLFSLEETHCCLQRSHKEQQRGRCRPLLSGVWWQQARAWLKAESKEDQIAH